MNNVSLVGNLTHDVETKKVGEHTVSRLRMAVNTPLNNDKEETLFIDVDAWNGIGKPVVDLRKGSQVAIWGRLVLDNWTGKDNVNRSKIFVKASRCLTSYTTGAKRKSTKAAEEKPVDPTPEAQAVNAGETIPF